MTTGTRGKPATTMMLPKAGTTATEGMQTTACRAPAGTLLPPTAGCQQQEVHQHQGRQQQWKRLPQQARLQLQKSCQQQGQQQ